MKARHHIIPACLLALASGTLLTGCGSDDVDETISVIVDSQTPENDLDRWLKVNFVDRYNIEMRPPSMSVPSAWPRC